MTNRLVALAIWVAIASIALQANIQYIIDGNGIQHLIMSALLVFVFSFLSSSLTTGMVFAFGIGVAKELIDPSFSQLDLSMDLIGVLIGAIIINVIRTGLRRL